MLSCRALAKLFIPVAVAATGWYAPEICPAGWDRVVGLTLAFVFVASVAVIIGTGRVRMVAVATASILICLVAAEAYAVMVLPRTIDIHTPGYSVSRPVLGWGPQHSGVFYHTKIDRRTGRVIADVDYTIDEHLNRLVVSAHDGPAVAFFGDSMTFGSGIADADTLPQSFADSTDRRIRVVNLAFAGYGPQQFLRALETGLYDDLLRPARLFVFETAVWHAERSSCIPSFMVRAPRYILAEGRPKFAGTCGKSLFGPVYEAITGSATYHVFFEPLIGGARRADIDLYIAILVRGAEIARKKYGVSTVILYLPSDAYAHQAGSSDQEIMRRLREGGLMVIDGTLDPKAFAGQPLAIPGDGHPTGVANRAWAALLRAGIGSIAMSAP